MMCDTHKWIQHIYPTLELNILLTTNCVIVYELYTSLVHTYACCNYTSYNNIYTHLQVIPCILICSRPAMQSTYQLWHYLTMG